MGGLVSRFRSRDDDNYEKILSELDDNIRRAEIRLSEIKIRERRSMIIWLVYSTLIYCIYVFGYLYFSGQTPENENWDVWAMKVAPVFTGPALILIVKNLLVIWYKRRETNEESQLEHVRAKQKQKVEELKKKTGYYTTKTLLERYDSPIKGPQQPVHPGTPLPHGQKGQVFRPGTPVQPGQVPINSNLRQRPPHSQPNVSSNTPNNGINGETPKLTNIEGDSTETTDTPRPYFPEGTPTSSTPLQRRWYDKLVDVIVGDEGPDTKYALVCTSCHAHNGLVLPQEIDDVQYICPKCNHFNPSRRSQREGITSKNGGVDKNLLADQDSDSATPRRGRSTKPRPMSRDSSSDPEKRTENIDEYEDDGVTVSKRLASRSTSRKRQNSGSQNRLGSRRGSDDEGRRYVSSSGDELQNDQEQE